ncbi:MAG TPA: CHAD domain-containing protein [Chthonomonadaceae bacterium]|nr:CHAD domain-containing protein [Chthonomonadaceae bacterium]
MCSRPKKSDGSAAETVPPTRLQDYATEIITARLGRMLSHIEGVRRSEEIEPVHQMRVWSRRSRAALEVFRCCFEGKDYDELEREVKAVTDALSEARDLDVMMDTLHQRAEALPPEQRGGVESFIARLRRRRERSQKPVLKALDRLESRDLAGHFADLVAAHTARKAAQGRKTFTRNLDG